VLIADIFYTCSRAAGLDAGSFGDWPFGVYSGVHDSPLPSAEEGPGVRAG
jgi:hypothetical protein